MRRRRGQVGGAFDSLAIECLLYHSTQQKEISKYATLLPMSQKSEGFARLDTLIAEHSEEWLLSAFVSRISDGESPQAVAVGMGLPWFVMRRWLEDSPDRMREWELGKRCFADGLAYESLRVVRDADPDNVAVARLQSETYAKTAGRVSRVEWGGESQAVSGFGQGGITIVIGAVDSPYLPAPAPATQAGQIHVPAVVENNGV